MDTAEQRKAIELLEHFIDGGEDDIVGSTERRLRYTGLDLDTVLTWAVVFQESHKGDDLKNVGATMFLTGFDVALRVAEERGAIGEVRPGQPIPLDGTNRRREE